LKDHCLIVLQKNEFKSKVGLQVFESVIHQIPAQYKRSAMTLNETSAK